MEQQHSHGHGNNINHEAKTKWVVLLTAITMVVEIVFGVTSGSMALLADGIHMGSHVLAIGLSWVAYIIVRRLSSNKKFSGNSNKILSLSGYTSGLLLLVFALFIIIEAIERFLNPVEIHYIEAVIVASVGLIVNVVSAFILHHKDVESDHNIKGAYLHVLADALTSVSAIVGLLIARYFDLFYIDIIVAIVSSFVIIRWSVGLLKDSGKVLLDIDKKENEHDGHHAH